MAARLDLDWCPLLRVLDQDVDARCGHRRRLDLRGRARPDKVGSPAASVTGTRYRSWSRHGRGTRGWWSRRTWPTAPSSWPSRSSTIGRIHKIRKRSSSGKTKWKTKHKTPARIDITLRLAKAAVVGAAEPRRRRQVAHGERAEPKGKRHSISGQAKYPLPDTARRRLAAATPSCWRGRGLHGATGPVDAEAGGRRHEPGRRRPRRASAVCGATTGFFVLRPCEQAGPVPRAPVCTRPSASSTAVPPAPGAICPECSARPPAGYVTDPNDPDWAIGYRAELLLGGVVDDRRPTTFSVAFSTTSTAMASTRPGRRQRRVRRRRCEPATTSTLTSVARAGGRPAARHVLWVTENHPPRPGGWRQSSDRIVRSLRRPGVDVDVPFTLRRRLAVPVDRRRGRPHAHCPWSDDPRAALRRGPCSTTTCDGSHHPRGGLRRHAPPARGAGVRGWLGLPLVPCSGATTSTPGSSPSGGGRS